MKKSSKSVSIVIPTFNGKHLLQQHLVKVLSSARANDELIIVDDASTDGSLSWLKRKFGLKLLKKSVSNPYPDLIYDRWQGHFLSGPKKISVSVVVNKQNLRFALSSNLGFSLARNRLVFLLNNDVSPDKQCVNRLVDTFTEKNIFAVACLEYEGGDISAQRSGKNRLWFDRGLFQHERANNFAFGVTAWASGGSSMFDRDKWQKLKGFDLKFQPAYWEDIDISWRAKSRGWRVVFQPLAVVFHQHESTNSVVFSSPQVMKLSWRHADYFTWKHGDIWQKFAFILWRPYWFWARQKINQTVSTASSQSSA